MPTKLGKSNPESTQDIQLFEKKVADQAHYDQLRIRIRGDLGLAHKQPYSANKHY